jgi:broad specificity phosphatase PhoE
LLKNMKVYLARHGHSAYNELGLCNADPSVPVALTELGQRQAGELVERLGDAVIQAIFTSELLRTQQTADIVSARHDAVRLVDARLNDNRSGFEGRPARDFYEALSLAPDREAARFNDGESLADVRLRTAAFMDDLRQVTHDVVLVVTSKIIVQAFYDMVQGTPKAKRWTLEVEKASCLELEL